MTPKQMASLHASCFTMPRPWLAAEFAEMLSQTGVFAITGSAGFALGRAIADEAELLTLAVAPSLRRCGHGRALLAAFEAAARQRAAQWVFLEVAASNGAARALYAQAGYREIARRSGYYAAPDGRAVDALLLRRALYEALDAAAFVAAEKR